MCKLILLGPIVLATTALAVVTIRGAAYRRGNRNLSCGPSAFAFSLQLTV